MQSAIFLLLGFPGTGKYTTAVELVRLLNESGQLTKLLDNHRVSNILFDLIAEADGATPLPAGIFPQIRAMNMAVLNTVKELSPRNWSFVLTHYLVDNSANQNYIDEIRRIAQHRGSKFFPIVLNANLEELLRRVPAPNRRAMQKLTDVGLARSIVESGDLLIPADALHIDITLGSPVETAQIIIKLANATSPEESL